MGHQKGFLTRSPLLSMTGQMETRTMIWMCTEAELRFPYRPLVGSTREIMVFSTWYRKNFTKSYKPSMESWCFASLKLMIGEDHLLIISQPCLFHWVMPLILAWPFHYAAVSCYCVVVQFIPPCLHCHFFLFLILCFPYRNLHSVLLLAWRVSRELYADPLCISHFDSETSLYLETHSPPPRSEVCLA